MSYPLGVKASTYKLLAGGLAAKGIITVRIDKRGMFDSAGAVADANAVTIDDYAVDLHAWVKVIRAKTGASCVWLLGHSEGGLVALASSRNAGDVCETAGAGVSVSLGHELALSRPVIQR